LVVNKFFCFFLAFFHISYNNAKKDKYLLMDPHYLPKRGTSSFGDWVSQKDLEEGALMVQTFFYYKAE